MKLSIYIFAILTFVMCASCAKQSSPAKPEPAIKIKNDPVADTYLEFMRSDLEKYVEKPELSLKAINDVIRDNPDYGFFYYQRALILAASGDWEGAVKDCKTALVRDPSNVDAKILIGKALGVLARHDEAVKYLEEAKKSLPDRQEVYALLAKEYMNVKAFKKAEGLMLELLKKDPESLVAYYFLGAIYAAYLKEPAKAIAIYEKLLDREPNNPQVVDSLAQLYLDTGRIDKALALLLVLEKKNPSDMALKLMIARVHYKLGDLDSTIKKFEDILKLKPDADKIMYYLASIYEEADRKDDAIKMYEQIPVSSTVYKDAIIREAYLYKVSGNDVIAKAVLLKGIKKKPGTMEFYQYLAGLYEREGNIDEAIEVLLRATKKFPDNENLHFAIGILYDRIRDTEKAIESMWCVLKLNPQNYSAMNYIGYVYVEEGKKLDEAEDLLQRAIKIKSDDPYIIDSLGYLYFKRGDLTMALTLFGKALKLAPDEPEINKHLGQIYMQKGDKKMALQYLNRALKLWEHKENVDQDDVSEVVSLVQEILGKK